MPKFYMGQKIKKVRGNTNLGATGRVVGFKYYPQGAIVDDDWSLRPWKALSPLDLQIQMDASWVNTLHQPQPRARIAYSESELWEPIVPDGEKKIEWKDCLFSPNGEGGLSYNRELIEEPAYVER